MPRYRVDRIWLVTAPGPGDALSMTGPAADPAVPYRQANVALVPDDYRLPDDSPVEPMPAETLAAFDAATCTCGSADDAHLLKCAKWQAVFQAQALRERLDRIGDWHSRETGPVDMNGDDYCKECGNLWPCGTRRMADGTYEEEQP